MSHSSAQESWRTFFAIELPAEVRSKIKTHIDKLRAELPDVRASWTREENLHLTMKFFGDVPVADVERISAAAAHAVASVHPFELTVGGCGAFPPKGQPRVLWIGTEDSSGSLRKLHAALENECADLRFPRDQRPYHPHLTIARLRQPHGARDVANLHRNIGFDSLPVTVEEICLVRSELRSQGSRYTVVACHAFR
jgi:2'-5' RNA ligase